MARGIRGTPRRDRRRSAGRRLAGALVLALLACPARAGGAAGGESLAGWSARAFGARSPLPALAPGTLVLRRQDHGVLGIRKSVLASPIRIGRRTFTRGLGTHAGSEILVALPADAREFRAWIGVDSNRNTEGKRGTVQFALEIAGREVFRSATLRGGGEPTEVRVKIPPSTKAIVLKAYPTADDASYDHADWADARIVGKDNKVMWLDDMKRAMPEEFLPADSVPFSFLYGGKRSGALLTAWKRTSQAGPADGRKRQIVRWADPNTGLNVVAEVTAFEDFPAVEWLLRFENRGKKDTPILSDVQALDLVLGTPASSSVVLDQITGDDCSQRSFVPVERPVPPGREARFAPNGGRPSNGTFPFFNIDNGDRGLFVAIGWTGQWAASVRRRPSGPTRVRAGMERTHLTLHPGEAIRTPRILLMSWQGRRIDAHNRFRRLLLAHYLPKVDGKPARPAIGAQSFNMNHRGVRPEWNTEAGQIAAAKVTRRIGCDTHWLDAAWFDGGFPGGVGNWTVRRREYPRGLKPVGEACRKLGLKFLIWWEPERVAPGTRIAREHPEFVLGGRKGGLFNLGDPKARRWLTDMLLRQIRQFGVETYRNDFNMDPLSYWRKNDKPDRQGMTEIRYVEGFYRMWDEIRAKNPGMVPDDCASGGRRIDLEMCMRSIVQTRSDTACAPGRADWDQAQTYGLSLFLPIHSTIGWDFETYDCRSTATAGFLGEWDILDPNFPVTKARAHIAEIKANRKYWYGDFYPLTAWSLAPEHWMAYQFHRSDLHEGIVLAFRRAASPYPSLQVSLGGIEPARMYEVTWIDEQRKATRRKLPGAELVEMDLRLARRRSSLLVRYKPARK